jgi:hypothetical protein
MVSILQDYSFPEQLHGSETSILVGAYAVETEALQATTERNFLEDLKDPQNADLE